MASRPVPLPRVSLRPVSLLPASLSRELRSGSDLGLDQIWIWEMQTAAGAAIWIRGVQSAARALRWCTGRAMTARQSVCGVCVGACCCALGCVLCAFRCMLCASAFGFAVCMRDLVMDDP